MRSWVLWIVGALCPACSNGCEENCAKGDVLCGTECCAPGEICRNDDCVNAVDAPVPDASLADATLPDASSPDAAASADARAADGGMGVSSLFPDHAQPRALVTIFGTFNPFGSVSDVDVEVPGDATIRAKVYSTSTPSRIVFVVPGLAASGPIMITTPPGTYVSPSPFTVDPPKPCAIGFQKCDVVPMDTLTTADIAGAAATPNAAVLFPADGRLVHATDPDREDWKRDATAGPILGRPAFDGTTLLAPRVGGTDLLMTTDGLMWTPLSVGATAHVTRVYAFGAGKFVALSLAQVFWTADTRTWHAGTVPASGGALEDVALAGARLVAVGTDGAKARAWTSDDGGMSWTDRPSAGAATTATLHGVAALGTTAIAVGAGGAIVASSDDGSTWSKLAFTIGLSPQDLFSAGSAGNLFIVAGANGTWGLIAKDLSSSSSTNLMTSATLRAVDPPFVSGDGGAVFQILGL